MNNHIKKCENNNCRYIEWGNEIEYKFIGYEDNS